MFAGACAVLVAIVIPFLLGRIVYNEREMSAIRIYDILVVCSPKGEGVAPSKLGAIHYLLAGSAIGCFHIWFLLGMGGGSQKGDDHHHGNRPHKPFKVLHATNTSKLLVLFLTPNAFDMVFDHLLRISQGLLTLGLRLFLKGIKAIL